MSFLSRIMVLKSKAHFSTDGNNRPSDGFSRSTFEGARKRKATQARSRVVLLVASFIAVYCVIGARLAQFAMTPPDTTSSILPPDRLMASRPDIVDRNGALLATDIRTVSLFAEPNKIIDPDEAVEELRKVLPDLDAKSTYKKLSVKSSHFAWLRRQLTPKQQSQILALGIPGIGFRPEKRRFYPGGSTAAHILGYVNIDNRGVAGMEKYIDDQGLADLAAAGMTNDQPLQPVKLSIDLRVQDIVHDAVVNAVKNFQAKGAGAAVINVHTGEVLAMASAPDFDPNYPNEGAAEGWLNRMTNGTFEMGSTFKTFTMAMAFDSGKVTLRDAFDATNPIRIGGFTIKDFHGQHRVLTVPEIFQYSSNIGTAKIADLVGIDAHKEFLTRIGLLTKMQTELPEVKMPTQPRVWKKINSITISFGHGVSTTPLQTAVAGAALVNGGKLIEPTFLPRSREQADEIAKLVVKKSTSDNVRFLLDFNGSKGSGRAARVPGYDVGSKTGTADKVVNGRYSNTLNFNTFMAAFPIDDPQYIIMTFCDEPKTGEHGGTISAYTAAPIARDIIARAAPILGIQPSFGNGNSALLVSY
ncbi:MULTISPECIES: penicillin-binding protein 2 [unclassified Rhizobium]|uniref:peptidoglycan D,D-transpeptidase FtsI family protein n=1 Tax=unclassified Rhizobium TaxID=2613769 RepID=UPI000DDC364B|nr:MULTISPECIES: penicillin-binding protein 2 [unclassified Rhizobium]MBB3285864.1 cell division protein FtsI (penicillin-binding protein 3) [Rhizobium sp. BK252]MBB3400974.1 cell division protein FtsI (penicillin-binding protein 3) [Rhizobium sp. BK289]MBB3413182.1 cell division protein FtsI (penicillin-binding protein 3) [Rhizobium sp. BK284]MBB3481440.1 cell division protein FtsI (penicillin-binding protein 3) [Rhizobium sp. BK347]MDK4723270.1 penicillin-binding protein 2 [Rhizobium sp. CNP